MTEPALWQALWLEENRRIRLYQITGNVIGMTSFLMSIWIIWAAIAPLRVLWWLAFPIVLVAGLGWAGVLYCRDLVVFYIARSNYWLRKLELAEEDEAAHSDYLADNGAPTPLTNLWVSVLMFITVAAGGVLLVAAVYGLSMA